MTVKKPKLPTTRPKEIALKRKATSNIVPQWKRIKLDPRPERIVTISFKEFERRFKDAKEITTKSAGSVGKTRNSLSTTKVIVKKLPVEETSRWTEGIPTEVEIIRSLNHENIAPILGVFKIDDDYLITMPDTKGVDLIKARLPEPWKIAKPDIENPGSYLAEEEPLTPEGITEVLEFASWLTNEAAKALLYLHRDCLIVHQNLKPENIILVERKDGTRSAQLIDFGSAKRYSREEREFTVDCGTDLYACRELYTNSLILGPEADIFSLGVIIHWLIFDMYPFKTAGHVKTPLVELKLPQALNVPEHAALREFLVNTLVKNPSERWTIEQVLSCDWVKQSHRK